MRGMHMKALWGGVAASALLFTVGCGATQNTPGVRAQEVAGSPAGSPVIVSCEPHQRTLVRPVVVNGATVSQVECVAADAQAAAAYAQAAYAQPVAQYAAPAYAPAAPVRYSAPRQVVYDDGLEDARVVRTSTARPVQTRQVVYQEPVRKTRSVKKSAAIIGSSAAVGAGIGALAKGKKGALIGAAIGGGGAAVWDQITRRK